MLDKKLNDLRKNLLNLGSVAVAFSGGVDSTFLLSVAHEALEDNCVAVTSRSPSIPQRELDEAADFCKGEGIRQIFIDSNELENEEYARNPENRCYICKRIIFSRIIDTARANGLNAVVEGSNADDTGDYRPGMRAVAELGVKSPLMSVGLTKAEIRELSKNMGLPTWDKPSFACLATRFVYGERITKDKLSMVGRAEQLLYEMGFKQFRVRIHGLMARIEVTPDELPVLMRDENRRSIVDRLKEYGFTYVTVDLRGYRTGSMNETIGAPQGKELCYE